MGVSDATYSFAPSWSPPEIMAHAPSATAAHARLAATAVFWTMPVSSSKNSCQVRIVNSYLTPILRDSRPSRRHCRRAVCVALRDPPVMSSGICHNVADPTAGGPMKTRSLRCAALASLLAFAGGAAAQGGFPSRPITIVVGFATGEATDTAARIIARKLSENMGVSVLVDNRAGAGGNIAHQQVANAAPDGYTILLGSVGPLAVAPHLVKNLPYDPQKDLAPLTMGVMFPNILVVNPGVPAKTLQEFVALAREKPGKLEYGSTGVGSASHLAGELLKQRAGIDLTHVPYKGGGAAMPDLLGGRIASYWSP